MKKVNCPAKTPNSLTQPLKKSPANVLREQKWYQMKK